MSEQKNMQLVREYLESHGNRHCMPEHRALYAYASWADAAVAATFIVEARKMEHLLQDNAVLRAALLARGHTQSCELSMDSGFTCKCGFEELRESSSASAEAPERERGWRCYHCDELITSEADARNHFGVNEGSTPACLIKAPEEFALLQALRDMESELAGYRTEDSNIIRAMQSMQADHSTALRREEEKGYERGVRDSARHGCQRSHPHENMSPECERLTELARASSATPSTQEIDQEFHNLQDIQTIRALREHIRQLEEKPRE